MSSMWDLHNTLVHGKAQETDLDLRARLIQKIEYLHTFKEAVRPQHADILFIKDLPTKLADKSFDMQQWIDNHEHRIYDSKYQQKTKPVKGVSNLRKWFKVIRKPKRPPKPRLRNARAKRARVQNNKIDRYAIRLVRPSLRSIPEEE